MGTAILFAALGGFLVLAVRRALVALRTWARSLRRRFPAGRAALAVAGILALHPHAHLGAGPSFDSMARTAFELIMFACALVATFLFLKMARSGAFREFFTFLRAGA